MVMLGLGLGKSSKLRSEALMRTRILSVIAIGLASAVSAAAVTGLAAQPAAAQAKVSREFGEPYMAARGLIQNKDYKGALSKLSQAEPHASSKSEKLAIEQLKTACYSGLGDKSALIKSLENQLAIGGLPANVIKNHRTTLAGLYDQTHNQAKAVSMTRDLIKDYGGSADQNAYVASDALQHKNYKDAISYANKAIELSKKDGKKPKEGWYQIVQRAYFDQKDNDNFYATVERTAADYPTSANLEILINRATSAPHFDRANNMLDVQRALVAAGAKLKPLEQAEMGEAAISRENSAESAKIFDALNKTSFAGIDASKVARYKSMYGKAQADAKTDEASGLAGREADAAAAGKGDRYLAVADTYLGAGNYAKAIELISKGLDKGGLDAGQIAYAKLDLGLAQYHSGKKDDARKTWAAIKSDNGAENLAKSWILISKK